MSSFAIGITSSLICFIIGSTITFLILRKRIQKSLLVPFVLVGGHIGITILDGILSLVGGYFPNHIFGKILTIALLSAYLITCTYKLFKYQSKLWFLLLEFYFIVGIFVSWFTTSLMLLNGKFYSIEYTMSSAGGELFNVILNLVILIWFAVGFKRVRTLNLNQEDKL